MSSLEEAVMGMVLAAAAKKTAEMGAELVSHDSSAVYARSARLLDERSHALFILRARGKCLKAILKELHGRDLSNCRLLMYTEDNGKAWLLAQLSEKVVRKSGNLKALRNFFSVVGDVMLHKSTLWATDQLLATGLWSHNGPLHKPGQLPDCEFSFVWGPELEEETGHSSIDGVRASTRAFVLEYNRGATTPDTHERIPHLFHETTTMMADLEECRGGEVWKFSGEEWLSSARSKSAALRVVNFVKVMRSDRHFRLPDAAHKLVDGILKDAVTDRAKGVAAVYTLGVAFRGIIACSIGNRMVGRRLLKKLEERPSLQERRLSALKEVSSLNVSSTAEEVGWLSKKKAAQAVDPQVPCKVFGVGYGVGVSGKDRCVMDLSSHQTPKPAEAILELGGSVLPDLSRRYRDRDTLTFGQTVISKRKKMTRVAFVRDPISIKLADHYDMVEVGGCEVNELSMLLGSLNLTYLTSEHAGIFQTWIYRALWSRLCGCEYDAVSSTHSALFDYASRNVSAWNRAGEEVNGPMLSSAALYLATEVIGKKAGSYDGAFGLWCEAVGLKHAMGNPLGVVADAPFHLQKCKVWKTGTNNEAGEAVKLGGKLLTVSRNYNSEQSKNCSPSGFRDVVQDDEPNINKAVPPTEESVKLR